jgi:hypothetical protein
MTTGDDDWDADEIRVCVDQYIAVLKLGGAKRTVSKDIYLARAEKQLAPKRSASAVVRRMGNISHVLEEAGGEPVIGWKPQSHVGPTNTVRIREMLSEHGVI